MGMLIPRNIVRDRRGGGGSSEAECPKHSRREVVLGFKYGGARDSCRSRLGYPVSESWGESHLLLFVNLFWGAEVFYVGILGWELFAHI